LKLYLQTFRNEGAFCEALATQICKDIGEALDPYGLWVMVKQKPRGGIGLTARAVWDAQTLTHQEGDDNGQG
jgi:7-cyano-7-deazaguanine reductase